MKKKYLTSQEYNSIVVTIQKSSNYITDKEKKEYDLIFEKLFVITDDDIISKLTGKASVYFTGIINAIND